MGFWMIIRSMLLNVGKCHGLFSIRTVVLFKEWIFLSIIPVSSRCNDFTCCGYYPGVAQTTDVKASDVSSIRNNKL